MQLQDLQVPVLRILRVNRYGLSVFLHLYYVWIGQGQNNVWLTIGKRDTKPALDHFNKGFNLRKDGLQHGYGYGQNNTTISAFLSHKGCIDTDNFSMNTKKWAP